MMDASDFPLKWLPTEMLAGVLQRVRPASRWQVELVDQQLQAVARTHAWRHTRGLDIDVDDFFNMRNFGIGWDSSLLRGRGVVVALDAAAAATVRAIARRARISEFRVFSDGSLDGAGQQTLLKAVAAALAAESPASVRLRHLGLAYVGRSCADVSLASRRTPAFCNCAELVQLVERNATTLESVRLHFDGPDGARSATAAATRPLYKAVGACTRLRHVDARLADNYCREELAVVVRGKRLQSLKLLDIGELDTQLFVDMPSPPTLQVMRLNHARFNLAHLLATKPEVLAKLRRFQAHCCDLGGVALLPLVRSCPELQLLMAANRSVSGGAYLCDEASLKALPRAYFSMADDEHTLFTRLPLKVPRPEHVAIHDAWVAALAELVPAWQADVADLRVDCFNEAVRATAALPAPVDEPPEWPHHRSPLPPPRPLFVLRLDGGKRRLALNFQMYFR